MDGSLLPWILFNLFVLAMLALDLGVFHRKAHEVGFKEAITWSAVWITLALLFNLGIYLFWPEHANNPRAYTRSEAAIAFLTGYVIEKSLSVDNIFVFLMIFTYFGVARAYQHKVLFWGILGALIMRAIFIFAGIKLIEKFHWMVFLLGGLLIVTGIKMATSKEKEIHPERNPVLRLIKRFMPLTTDYHRDRFFVRIRGRLLATPLFMVLVLVETTDLIFAVDSIPAILAITREPFIVYTSNVFAILGLRALYFALAGFMEMFYYLSYGLAAILIFVGGKMIAQGFDYKLKPEISLGVVACILAIAVVASVMRAKREGAKSTSSDDRVDPTLQERSS